MPDPSEPPTPGYDSEPGGGGDPPTPRYPEHAKLEALKGANQTVGEFIDWLRDAEGLHLMKWEPDAAVWAGGVWHEDGRTPEELIAGFFDLDLRTLEAEKRQMLDEIRAAHERRPAE